MKLTAAIAAIATAATIAAAGTARASFVMTLQNGATNIPVADNGAGDVDPTVGVINFFGSVGAFSFTVTAGTSNSPGATVNGVDQGVLQVTSIAVRNTTATQETLTITLADNNFNKPNATSKYFLFSSLTGTMLRGAVGSDSISFQSYVDPTNAGGTTNTTGLQTAVANGLVTGIGAPDANIGPITSVGMYSMKNVTTIKLSGGAQANISGTSLVIDSSGVTPPTPEPTTAGILGVSSAALLLRRRRKA